jgi:hypothetical protein
MSPVARWACHGPKPVHFCRPSAACCRCRRLRSGLTKRGGGRRALRIVGLRRDDRCIGAARRLRHALVRGFAGRRRARRSALRHQSVSCSVTLRRDSNNFFLAVNSSITNLGPAARTHPFDGARSARKRWRALHDLHGPTRRSGNGWSRSSKCSAEPFDRIATMRQFC